MSSRGISCKACLELRLLLRTERIRQLLALLALGGLACACVYLGAWLYQWLQTEQPAATGVTAAVPAPAAAPEPTQMLGLLRPAFSLPDLEGRLRSVDEWNGKVIALNFWATWCPPCLEEVPEFIGLQARYQDAGLQFVGIALQRPEEVRGFAQQHGMNYPTLAGEQAVMQLAQEYGNHLGALPYTVLIGRDGRIAYVRVGALSGAQAETLIQGLL